MNFEQIVQVVLLDVRLDVQMDFFLHLFRVFLLYFLIFVLVDIFWYIDLRWIFIITQRKNHYYLDSKVLLFFFITNF